MEVPLSVPLTGIMGVIHILMALRSQPPPPPSRATQPSHPLGEVGSSLLPVFHLDAHGLSWMQPGYRFLESCSWDDGADLQCRNFSDLIHSRIPYRQIN